MTLFFSCAASICVLFLEHKKIFLAFSMGSLGSLAYLAALYFRFVGLAPKDLNILLEPFKDCSNENHSRSRWWVVTLKGMLYASVGGFIAVVFQWDVQNFVPVQDLIMGITWPTVVTQFLSGRLAGPRNDEKDKIDDLQRNSTSEMNADSIRDIIQSLKALRRPVADNPPSVEADQAN
jgi:hypothetical protein